MQNVQKLDNNNDWKVLKCQKPDGKITNVSVTGFGQLVSQLIDYY